jgi:uncharacterized protein (DUF2237 family)
VGGEGEGEGASGPPSLAFGSLDAFMMANFLQYVHGRGCQLRVSACPHPWLPPAIRWRLSIYGCHPRIRR